MTSKSTLLLTLGLAAATSAPATIISWNYDSNGTVTGTNVAGVAAAANWNNSWPANPTTDLIDETGAATTLDLAYASYNGWRINGSHPGVDGDGSYNKELLNGYLNAGPAGWNPPTTTSSITLTEIPFAAYDLIVYFSSDVGGREGDITDGTTTFSFNTVGPASTSGANALFAQTTDTTGSYSVAANYAIFTGLTGASQTVTVAMRDNDEWGGIAGFQVVSTAAVPEPSTTAALIGGAVLAVALLRRRRRA